MGLLCHEWYLPPTVKVVADGTGAHIAGAVLPGEVFYFNDYVAHLLFFLRKKTFPLCEPLSADRQVYALSGFV